MWRAEKRFPEANEWDQQRELQRIDEVVHQLYRRQVQTKQDCGQGAENRGAA